MVKGFSFIRTVWNSRGSSIPSMADVALLKRIQAKIQ
jgi:hypothetical protein